MIIPKHGSFNLDRFVQVQVAIYDTALDEIRHEAEPLNLVYLRSDPQARYEPDGTTLSDRLTRRGTAPSRLWPACPVVKGLFERVPRSARQGCRGGVWDIDAMMQCSFLILFATASRKSLFEAALEEWCGGPDARTARRLDELLPS